MAKISGVRKTEFCVKLPVDMLEVIDGLVSEGYFAARSEVIMYSLYRLFFENAKIECVRHEGLKRLVCFRVPRRFVDVLVYEFNRWGCGSMSDLVRSALSDFLRVFNTTRPQKEEEDLPLIEGRPVGNAFKYRY